ncbi:hypothetical protein FIBSPDRAFT_962629 [Athelia psychrophila]|uniref:Uncharacterized protein n=1 Tax=Athelia psychrophila TaxID=1759441 RepID=A0A165ZYS3_9AGAM|nr:hypothetical protein FIBSPDRAFT_962629 [Fibularhizoctonia sp. CBS 109695]
MAPSRFWQYRTASHCAPLARLGGARQHGDSSSATGHRAWATIMAYIPQIFLAFNKIPGYRGLAATTVQVVENIMISRVHRAVILGLITDGGHDAAPFAFTTIVPTTTASSENQMLMELAAKQKLV